MTGQLLLTHLPVAALHELHHADPPAPRPAAPHDPEGGGRLPLAVAGVDDDDGIDTLTRRRRIGFGQWHPLDRFIRAHCASLSPGRAALRRRPARRDHELAVIGADDPHRTREGIPEDALVEHLGRRTEGRHRAAREQQQPVGELPGQREVVHGAHHGQTPLPAQLVDDLEGLHPVRQVECARRLVHQEDRRLLGQGPRQDHPLALTSREGRQVPRRQLGQLEALEQAGAVREVGVGLDGEVADVRCPPEQAVVEHRHVRRQLRGLRHVGDGAGTLAPTHGRGRLPPDAHLTLVLDQAHQRPQQRGLPGAVRPDEAHPLSPPDRRRHRVDGGAAVEAHRHRVELHHGAVAGNAGAASAPAFRQADDRPETRHQDSMPRPARRDTSTTRKNGAPMQAVTTPMGTSAGDCAVRAIRSAPTRNAAPPTIATGRMMR